MAEKSTRDILLEALKRGSTPNGGPALLERAAEILLREYPAATHIAEHLQKKARRERAAIAFAETEEECNGNKS